MSGDQSENRGAVRSEAAGWFNLRLAGDMTVQDEYRFREWLDQSDANGDAFRTIDRAWTIAGIAGDDPALELSRKRDVPRDGLEDRRFWQHWPALALAAAVLLVVGISSSILPALLSGGPVDQPQEQAFRTGTGQRSVVTLPDGSVVTLDSESKMRFQDLPNERRVDLVRGRAFFRVASNRSRPFLVYAAGKSVRAVGTQFEVSLEHGEMSVILAEGKVRVEESAAGAGNGTDMVPGRQLVVGADHDWTLSRVDVEKETSWTEGRLTFMHDPLSEAMADMNRYSIRKLVFKGGHVPDMQIVGVFAAGDVDSFVKALELNGIAHPIATSSNEIVLVGDK